MFEVDGSLDGAVDSVGIVENDGCVEGLFDMLG